MSQSRFNHFFFHMRGWGCDISAQTVWFHRTGPHHIKQNLASYDRIPWSIQVSSCFPKIKAIFVQTVNFLYRFLTYLPETDFQTVLWIRLVVGQRKFTNWFQHPTVSPFWFWSLLALIHLKLWRAGYIPTTHDFLEKIFLRCNPKVRLKKPVFFPKE